MYRKLSSLKKNIGKRAKVIQSTVAGLTNQTGDIVDVSGNDIDGYRYTFISDKPIHPWSKDLGFVFYPPVFLVEIINE